MPWPIGLLNWLIDPAGPVVLTSIDGSQVRCRMPYPKSNWRDERRWNDFLIDAMEITLRANAVFEKDAEKWNKAEREFFKWVTKYSA